LDGLLKAESLIQYEPYRSYAPPRASIRVQYFIDGENYYAALAKALPQAKTCIYITGWWFTPELYLTRTADRLDHRLDHVLHEAATRGVKIYLLLWDNVEQVEDIKNREAAQRLERLSPHIMAMLHTSPLSDGYSHHQKIVCIDECDAFVGGLDLCLHRWDQQSHPITPTSLFPGKDYFNSRFLGENNNVLFHEEDYQGLKGRHIPRSGWHDIHCRVDGLAAADVSRNFVQRWNFVRSLKRGGHRYPPLELPPDTLPPLPSAHATEQENNVFQAPVQLTRSISSWALNTKTTERSIWHAINRAIHQAETFVYIETQFFISVQGDPNLINQHTGKPESLADALVNRIRRAVRLKQPFKVIVVLPMFPEGDPTTLVTQQIMQEQLKTIEYIQTQVNELTQGMLADHEDYIRFYSLGNIAYHHSRIVAEQIYIHAKLLITDRHVIIGSANLNMRSLTGNRDTEIAVVVESPKMAQSLRKDLWREHLGEEVSLTDRLLEDVALWEGTAESNTRVYRKLFKGSCPLGAPRNKAEFLCHHASYQDLWEGLDGEGTFQQATLQLRGHLVEFPQHFLVDDVRTPLGVRGALREGDFGALVVSIRRDLVQ